jgi:hypothetical protein
MHSLESTKHFYVFSLWCVVNIYYHVVYHFLFATFNGMSNRVVRKHFGVGFYNPSETERRSRVANPTSFLEECLALNYLRAFMHYFRFQTFLVGS